MYKAWSYDSNHNSYTGVKEMRDKLPQGLYTLHLDAYSNPYLTEQKRKQDRLQFFSAGPMQMVLTEIEQFWQARDRYKAFGVTHKRGILLHGPAGCGKTGIVAYAMQRLIGQEGLVLMMDDVDDFRIALPLVRQSEEGRNVMVLIEDIEKLLVREEEGLLEVLDGSSSLGDGLLFLATTNELDKVPPRIRCRPSRIDTLVEVGLPNEQQRFEFLKFLQENLDRLACEMRAKDWAMRTPGFSLAQLKELVLGVMVYNRPIEVMLERLKELSPQPETGEDDD